MSPFDNTRKEEPVSPVTPRQRAFLARHNLQLEGNDDHGNAGQAIRRFILNRRELSPTDRQVAFLQQRGLWREGMSRGEAFDLIRATIAKERR